MKFNSEIVRKAWAIFKSICPNNTTRELKRIYLSEAYKSAIKFFKGLKNGLISFFKLPKKNNDVVEVTTRKIQPLQYENKGGVSTIKPTQFLCMDADKGSIISFHHYQLV